MSLWILAKTLQGNASNTLIVVDVLDLTEESLANTFSDLKQETLDAIKSSKKDAFNGIQDKWNAFRRVVENFVPFPKSSDLFTPSELNFVIKEIDNLIKCLNGEGTRPAEDVSERDITKLKVDLISTVYDAKSKNFKVGINPVRMKDLLDTSNDLNTSRSVSFVGGTHVGKSSLIRALQSRFI